MTTHVEVAPRPTATKHTLPTLRALRWAVPLGRLLFAAIFLVAAPNHFSQNTIGYAAAQGVPAANILVPLSGLLALAGGLSILLGLRARFGALLLIVFLVPVTLMMHRFWAVADPQMAMMQLGMFLKNVSMLGGALAFLYFGAGPYSFDELRRRRAAGMPLTARRAR